MSPGPNNLLAMANGKRFGLRIALIAGLGRIAAFAVMITLAAMGLATVLYNSEKVFLLIKLVGGFYLLWMAFQLWRADPAPHAIEQLSSPRLIPMARQELLLASGNPKAILIFTAFLPQFITPSAPIFGQFLVLGIAFLLLEFVAIFLYACFGHFLRHWFSRPAMRQLFNRGCATLLGLAGLGLLASGR